MGIGAIAEINIEKFWCAILALTKLCAMLEPIRTARVIGGLVLLQGAIFLLFWKIMGLVIAVGTQRYSSVTGKMAKAFFSQDKALIQLLQASANYLHILLILGLIASACGILMLAFPKQTAHVLVALRILKRF